MMVYWKKLLWTAIGIALSSALAWLVIFPYVILPQIGISEYSTVQLVSLMLAGFILTLIIVGATIRSFREFAIIAVASGIMMKISEMIWAFFIPFGSNKAVTEPLEFWTIGLLFSVIFAALILVIGIPFGWVARRLSKPDIE